MGNCINWNKTPTNPEEKLCRELINELKEKRKNQLKEHNSSIKKRKLKFQQSKTNKFFEDDSTNNQRSLENTRDTFFAKSGSSFQNSQTQKFFFPQFQQFQVTGSTIRRNSAHSRSVSRNSTPEKNHYLYTRSFTQDNTYFSPNLVLKKNLFQEDIEIKLKSEKDTRARSVKRENKVEKTNVIYCN